MDELLEELRWSNERLVGIVNPGRSLTSMDEIARICDALKAASSALRAQSEVKA